MEQKPRIGRVALLSLVDWITKRSNGSTCIERHGVGDGSSRVSGPINKFVGGNGDEGQERCETRSVNQ